MPIPSTLTADSILNAFTVDVEDYFHVTAFADRVRPQQWEQFESRVVRNTERLLRLLDRHHIRATFFVLGWVADRFSSLVETIQRSGHEIGCHSYWHRLVYNLTPEEFRDDLHQAEQAIASTTGCRPRAYRAPSWSITANSQWALDVLMDEGYECDSSIFPIFHDLYGIPDSEPFLHRLHKHERSMWEFPPTVYSIGRWNVPIAGGGYFRLYPAWLSLHWLSRINRIHNEPFMFYIHPWELDPEQPRLPGSWRSRFRHYQNLRGVESKLERFLTRFRFGSMSDAIRERLARERTMNQHDRLGEMRQLPLGSDDGVRSAL